MERSPISIPASEGTGHAPRASGPGWAYLALLVSLLLSPPVYFRIASGDILRRPDSAFLWVMGLSAAWVLALHTFFRRPVLLHLLLAPVYVLVGTDLFLIHQFGSRLTTSYLSIIVTDHSEAGEFARAYAKPLAVGIALLIGTWALGVWGIRRIRISWPRNLRWVAVGLVLLGYGVAVLRQVRTHGMPASQAVVDVASHDFSSPVGSLSQIGVTLSLLADTGRFVEARRSFSFGASQTPAHRPEVYLFVIGESSRPDRWSLNGYGRPTNPRLSSVPNLVSFTDVLTTSPSTAVAVPSILSLAPITDWPAIQSQKSIVGAFREAGFFTWWLSAQEVSQWGGIIPILAEEAHRRRYYDRSLDQALVDELRRILSDPARPQRLFIVLHTRGSHFEFSKRYPPEFRIFPEDVPGRAQYLSNTFDNSVVYTDHVLAEMIDAVNSLGVRSAVVFVSDHGENLLDDDRQLFGHAIGNEYDLPTAALAWWSDELARAEPEKIEAVRRARSAPLSAADFSHSLLDLASIEARGLDRTRSVFSPRLESAPRHFVARGKLGTWTGVGGGSAEGRSSPLR